MIGDWLMARLAPILGGLLVAALIGVGVQSWRVGSLQETVRKLQTELQDQKTFYAVFRAKIIDRTAQALVADRANVRRAVAEQARISEERTHAYRDRIAALDARVAELRRAKGKAGNGGGAAARMPAAGNASGGADAAARGDGFSLELRAVATRLAIRLDELQKWVKSQGQVDNSGRAGEGGRIDYFDETTERQASHLSGSMAVSPASHLHQERGDAPMSAPASMSVRP